MGIGVSIQYQLHQSSSVGVHRCLPQLRGIHFTQTFKTLNIGFSTLIFSRQALEDAIALSIIEGVIHLFTHIDAVGKEVYYALDDAERNGILERLAAENKRAKPNVQRFKGLGEMNPGQLRETTMDPDTRRLVQLILDADADTHSTFDMLLAKKRSGDRKTWLESKGDLADIAV